MAQPPTRHTDRSSAAADGERFKQISEAYRVLSDDGSRALVDDYLEQRTFRRASFRGEDSFVDRLAGKEGRRGRGRLIGWWPRLESNKSSVRLI